MESRPQAAAQLLRRLGPGAGHAGLRQRVQGAVGIVSAPRRRRMRLPVGPSGRRERCATRGMRRAELARAAMDRCAGAGDLEAVGAADSRDHAPPHRGWSAAPTARYSIP